MPKTDKEKLAAARRRIAQLERQVKDLEFELMQSDHQEELRGDLTSLAAKLREAMPDAFVSDHLEDMVGSPEGALVATIRGFKTGRLGEVGGP